MLETAAERLSAFLKYKDLKQKEFCKITGYAENNLSNFLTGRTANPRIELVEALANHFPELDLVWLFSGSGRMLRESSDVAAEKTTLADLRATEETEDKNEPITRKEIITLLMKRVNELEREIMRKDPELARELGIDERLGG
ncbi:MAG: helix-turn-helix transcriptional regulator [Bacteroidetes bacterium]|nr:helix-turn-helix transcriptional regulator [Bacteroidota bacterium]